MTSTESHPAQQIDHLGRTRVDRQHRNVLPAFDESKPWFMGSAPSVQPEGPTPVRRAAPKSSDVQAAVHVESLLSQCSVVWTVRAHARAKPCRRGAPRRACIKKFREMHKTRRRVPPDEATYEALPPPSTKTRCPASAELLVSAFAGATLPWKRSMSCAAVAIPYSSITCRAGSFARRPPACA